MRKTYLEKIIGIKPRNEIYNYIKDNPGVHFRQISRSLDTPPSTLNYHLKYLEKRDFLSKKEEHGYLRFYISGKVGRNDKKYLNILRETVPRNIILYLFLYVESSQQDILKFAKKWKNHPSKIGYHLNKHHTTLGFHLSKLLEEGLLESEKRGTEVTYRIKEPEVIVDLIIRYDKSVLQEAYGRFLKYVVDHGTDRKDGIDELIDIFYDIFPPSFRS